MRRFGGLHDGKKIRRRRVGVFLLYLFYYRVLLVLLGWERSAQVRDRGKVMGLWVRRAGRVRRMRRVKRKVEGYEW